MCAGAVVLGKVPALPLLFLFIMLQGFSLVGAAWATRLKRKITQRQEQLPLANRRA
jgi:uncharacterized membrane protein